MLFKLGKVSMTVGIKGEVSKEDLMIALERHREGDWGEVSPEDAERNNEALEDGARLLSSYTDPNGTKFWIITEADRSYTTFLLPEEY